MLGYHFHSVVIRSLSSCNDTVTMAAAISINNTVDPALVSHYAHSPFSPFPYLWAEVSNRRHPRGGDGSNPTGAIICDIFSFWAVLLPLWKQYLHLFSEFQLALLRRFDFYTLLGLDDNNKDRTYSCPIHASHTDCTIVQPIGTGTFVDLCVWWLPVFRAPFNFAPLPMP